MPKPCKDCVTEWLDNASAESKLLGYERSVPERLWRNAPNPGPRCATHWRAERRRRKAARHGNYVQKTYGLGEHDYSHLYEAQNGVCFICQRANGATRKLSVDHDHKCCSGPVSCGACVRGLLCRPCNDLLGHCRDDWRMLARAIRYLQDPPAPAILAAKRGGKT
jgi:hypothetical protein